MAKAFSVLSWNVEHFGAMDAGRREPRKKIGPILDLIAQQKADVIAIYEVVGAVVCQAMVSRLPNYQFHITEGPQTQEILIGVHRNLCSFFTQRVEFRSGQTTLRPGALLSLRVGEAWYPLLFLHLKSLPQPKGFGLRDDMTERAFEFRRVLDKAAGGAGKANYIFLGDLNTMGMNLTHSGKDVTADEEIDRLRIRAKRAGVRMKLLEKTRPATFWPGSQSSLPPGDLDHVVAADHLQFRLFGGKPVAVRGWPELATDADKDDWAKRFSDHAMLYFEVQKG
jgi:endonuclease/exonuclease/phosphatase family metal-dependent hydrolase